MPRSTARRDERSHRALPDPAATPARLRIAEWLGVPADAVLVANGAADVFWTAARAWLRPGDAVLIAEPAFSEMRAAALRAGARIVECRSTPDTDFAFDERHFASLLLAERTPDRLVAIPANLFRHCRVTRAGTPARGG